MLACFNDCRMLISRSAVMGMPFARSPVSMRTCFRATIFELRVSRARETTPYADIELGLAMSWMYIFWTDCLHQAD